MTKINKPILGILLVLAILAWFTMSISSILLPFILALILAYFLHPLVVSMQKQRFPRGFSTAVVTLVFCLFILSVFLIFIPILQTQIMALMVKVPTLVSAMWNRMELIILYAKENITPEQLNQISKSVSASVFGIFNALSSNLLKMLTGGVVVFNMLSLLLITPIVLFYVLRDWNSVEEKMADLIPEKNKPFVKSVCKDVNRVLSGFIRGQATVCLFLGIFYGVGLSLIGLDLGLLVGFLAGILSFIPYFGCLSGIILSVLLALVQQASLGLWIGLAAVFILGQVLESYILTPKLVGDKVGLHPVWVIFALLAGGALFGFVGVLVAVPVAGVIGVLTRRFLLWYKSTSIYKD